MNSENRFNWTVGVLVIFVAALTVVTAVLTAQINKVQNDLSKNTNTDSDTPSSIFWDIVKVAPNSDNSQNKDLTLTSNAGAVREYKDNIAYGISNNGKFLAIRTIKGIEVIDLDKNTKKLAELPIASILTNYGEVISWSSDNEYFTLAVQENGALDNTHIWIFSKDAKVTNNIKTYIPFSESTNSLYNPIFSKNSNQIIIRTYKLEDSEETKDDGSAYTTEQLPVYLTIYNLDGTTNQELFLRDFNETRVGLYYRWANDKNNAVQFYLMEANQQFDMTKDFLLTEIRL